MADYNKLKKEYIKGGVSYRQLSEKYGVSISALKRLGAKEHWGELRDQVAAETSQKLVDSISEKNADVGARLYAVTERLLAKVERAVEELDIALITNSRKEKTIEYNNRERPDKPTREVVVETEEVLQTSSIVDRAGLKAIAATLRDIKEIHNIHSDMDKMEQQARIDKLRKDSEQRDEGKTVVEIVMEGIPEKWIG